MASPLTYMPGDQLHTYGPPDLDDMSPRQAVDAVVADIRDHRITVDGTSMFNMARHIGLLRHLAASMAADAEYQLAPNVAALPPAENLGASAGHVGRGLAHYTQAPALFRWVASREVVQLGRAPPHIAGRAPSTWNRSSTTQPGRRPHDGPSRHRAAGHDSARIVQSTPPPSVLRTMAAPLRVPPG
ncbi:hypothetical protein ACWC9U_34490 [Streptomyces sp. 900116325]